MKCTFEKLTIDHNIKEEQSLKKEEHTHLNTKTKIVYNWM